ncbi:DUF4260 domain-containing protein [Mucilaginibacter paludis]|uniref:DUF4260 domain-containing protein n=1 Tax=Mucilaginibacter paludis DSM 18603 TaxID=714943 RepID=H1Y263_9SPHI|nr:DUF4260 domain-containing protein [Mucilaginibacter paludis]EHQ26720.1 hypothetical protein Mucpa_2605 [Mucilaginibacter paludis DSM 18603]
MNDQNKPQEPFTKPMALNLKFEEVAITGVAIYFLTRHSLGFSFWVWIPLFLMPDLSMLGYLFNNRVGALTYNLFHHRGLALLLSAAGFLLHQEIMISLGILLFAHSSFDRMFGYGLKYNDSFNHTSLGWTGKNKTLQ